MSCEAEARPPSRRLRGAAILGATAVGGISGLSHPAAGSTAPSPGRPNGLSAIVSTFGAHCNAAANDAATTWPHGNDQPTGDVLTHQLLAEEHGYARYLLQENNNNLHEVDRAVWGYNCRVIAGSSNYSVHSWGIAVDTNSVKNPRGQSSWDGTGDNGTDYKNQLPDLWQRPDLVNHYWGLNFSSIPDPMHFQYATGY